MNESAAPTSNQHPGWKELWLKEDWWAVWIGLAFVLVSCGMFAHGASLDWIAVMPKKWATLDQLHADFAAKGLRYLAPGHTRHQFFGCLFEVHLYATPLTTR